MKDGRKGSSDGWKDWRKIMGGGVTKRWVRWWNMRMQKQWRKGTALHTCIQNKAPFLFISCCLCVIPITYRGLLRICFTAAVPIQHTFKVQTISCVCVVFVWSDPQVYLLQADRLWTTQTDKQGFTVYYCERADVFTPEVFTDVLVN